MCRQVVLQSKFRARVAVHRPSQRLVLLHNRCLVDLRQLMKLRCRHGIITGCISSRTTEIRRLWDTLTLDLGTLGSVVHGSRRC